MLHIEVLTIIFQLKYIIYQLFLFADQGPMTKESTKKTWKGKVAKQWKRMQGSSSAPNTSYPEGGSIGKSNHFLFFFLLCCSTICCGLKIEGNMQCCNMYCFRNLDLFFFHLRCWTKKCQNSDENFIYSIRKAKSHTWFL